MAHLLHKGILQISWKRHIFVHWPHVKPDQLLHLGSLFYKVCFLIRKRFTTINRFLPATHPGNSMGKTRPATTPGKQIRASMVFWFEAVSKPQLLILKRKKGQTVRQSGLSTSGHVLLSLTVRFFAFVSNRFGRLDT